MESLAMDVSFIKKEEPVDYALIVPEANQDTIYEKSIGADVNDPEPFLDIYTISIKEEPQDNYNLANEGDDSSEDNVEEDKQSDEDWTISSLKTMKTMKSKRKGPFKCEMCSSVYKKKFALKSHIQAHIINGLEKECCNVCNKFYPKSCMEMHLLLHKGPPYHCQICAKEFTKHACYRHHTQNSHREKDYVCDICNKRFVSKALVSSHLQTHIDRERSFRCDFCKAGFYRNNSLRRHIRTIHSTVPRRTFKCTNPECNRTFLRQYELTNHKCRGRKGNGNPWPKKGPCAKCNKIFVNPFKYQLHFQQNCPKHIVYECDLCHKLINGKQLLLKHINNHKQTNNTRNTLSSKDYTNTCVYCGRLFRVRGILKLHIERGCSFRQNYVEDFVRPNGSKHFQCDICDCKFPYKAGIIEHFRIMHATETISGVSFRKKIICSKHMAHVVQYQCCDEYFTSIGPNPRHVKTDKCRFKCKRCRFVFLDFYSLIRHSAEHKMRAFQSFRHLHQCKQCNRRFQWKRSIPKHLKSAPGC